MRTIPALFAATVGFACYAQDKGQLDCNSLLRGTQTAVGKDYKPPEMSTAEIESATSSRVCIMSFVQLDVLRPLLKQDPRSASKLDHIDQLYKLKRSLPRGAERGEVDDRLENEIHELFADVRNLPPDRLGAIADQLRSSKSVLTHEGYDSLQPELMARYLQVAALKREGRALEIPAVVGELRANTRAGAVVDSGLVDKADVNTYFRPETLWSAITAFELSAAANISAGRADVISFAAKYLDIPQSSLNIAPGPDFDTFLVPLTKTLKAAASLPNGAAKLRSLDGVAGATDSGGHFDVYVESKKGLPARVLRYSRASGRVVILDAAPVFQAEMHEALTRYSSPQMRLVSVVREGDDYAIQAADNKFTLTSSELQTLRNGDPLGSAHALSREILSRGSSFVLYSHPLMHEGSPYLKEAEDVAFSIQRAYPSVRVFRDDFNPRTTPEHVRSIDEFRIADTSRVVAIIAEDSFRIDDKRVIQNIQATLTSRGVTVKLWKHGLVWDMGSGRAVIVITGHIDAQLAGFVRELGRAGAFKGNYVVFGSCYSDLSSDLAREINTDFEAVGTFRFEGKISPYDLKDVVTDLTDRIGQGQGKFGFSMALRKSVHRSALGGIWTVCLVQVKGGMTRG